MSTPHNPGGAMGGRHKMVMKRFEKADNLRYYIYDNLKVQFLCITLNIYLNRFVIELQNARIFWRFLAVELFKLYLQPVLATFPPFQKL